MPHQTRTGLDIDARTVARAAHGCDQPHHTYRSWGACAWRSVPITGSGPFATQSRCPGADPTVELHPRLSAARAAVRHLDDNGCAPTCRGQHSLTVILLSYTDTEPQAGA